MVKKTISNVLIYILIFLAGFFTAYFWQELSMNNGITGAVIEMPSDFVDEKEIYVFPDEVVIKVDGAKVTNYEDTGSMQPILGVNTNGIVIKPSSADEIQVGDIVSFQDGEGLVVHRVIEKGTDAEGVYFITKGDSSDFPDGKIRFEDIEHKLVGLIY